MARRNMTISRHRQRFDYEMNRENHHFELQLDSNRDLMIKVQVNQINNLSELFNDFKDTVKLPAHVNIKKDYVIKSENGLIVGDIGDIDSLRPSSGGVPTAEEAKFLAHLQQAPIPVCIEFEKQADVIVETLVSLKKELQDNP